MTIELTVLYLLLLRAVVEHLEGLPHERILARDDHRKGPPGIDLAHVLLLRVFFPVFGKILAIALQRLGCRLRRKRRGGDRERAVPVRIEAVRELSHRRAYREHVEVAELEAFAGGKVFVADVASARDADDVVDQEQ